MVMILSTKAFCLHPAKTVISPWMLCLHNPLKGMHASSEGLHNPLKGLNYPLKGLDNLSEGLNNPSKGMRLSFREMNYREQWIHDFCAIWVAKWCNWPDCRFCSTLRNIVIKFECMVLMPSASQVTLRTFLRWKDGKAKTRTAVDAENFRVPCCKRQNALSSLIFI